ncbi:IS1595 family transposase [Xanthomonas tesorieronis]|uniref:IS1595 family transposase n=1 Tax=Xanthomonas tesorieronis TaxID=3160839 RepID=UPI003519C3F7
MAMNRVQFQRGMSLPQFLQHYGTEEQCVSALLRNRWPDGFVCPRCGQRAASQFQRGHQRLWQCRQCRAQTSLTAGTVLADTKLPLRLWWMAMYLLSQAKNGISALELMRHLDVCYRTAWRIKHKLMAAMAEREGQRQLAGWVQIDDAYLGGERARGSGAEQWTNKIPFIAAVETRQGRPGCVRFDWVGSFCRDAVHRWAQQALAPGTHVLSDGLTAFTAVTWAGMSHEPIVTGTGRKSVQQPALKWVNTILGNLKTALGGTHHAIAFGKYGLRYLRAHQYQVNRRFNLAAILDQLGLASMATHAIPERALRAPAEIRR